VENDISARVSYVDGRQPNLVREQIRLALGEKIGYSQKDVEFKGAAIELRIVAEDTKRGFAPWIGTISKFKFPQYDWSTVYTHVPFDRPYTIPSDYDPNLALALVWGDTVEEAKKRAFKLLKEISIRGKDSSGGKIITNLSYLKENLNRLLTF
jgi:biotin carboxylase